MLATVEAIEFVRSMANGKTAPSLITCEKDDGDTIEVVAKFSLGCERGVTSLAMEVVGACLASDLGLPIPQPVIVRVSPEFIDSVTEDSQKSRMKQSNAVAFGSRHITGQYSVWTAGTIMSEMMKEDAAAIFAFDGIIQNPDRRDQNPNCLVKGDEMRIIDHELSFAHGMIIGWRPPWVLGGLDVMTQPGFHIFREGLRGKALDFDPIQAAWTNLTDDRIEIYAGCVPDEWAEATNSVATALQLIKNARDNIEACIEEMKRVLQ